MRYFTLMVFLVLFIVSCQNQTTDKTTQRHSDDSTKEHKPTANVNATKPDSSNGDFLIFWQKFRADVLNFDTTQIIKQTQFPFQTRGSLDSDPIIEYSKKKFIRVFRVFLNQWNGRDLDGGTELDLIKKAELPGEDDVHGNYARIGDLVFDKSNNGWKFVFAYLNYDTIESLEK